MNYRYAIEDNVEGFPIEQRDFTKGFFIPRFARVGGTEGQARSNG